jgi:NitT/TauT family transport system substrate-binding protein
MAGGRRSRLGSRWEGILEALPKAKSALSSAVAVIPDVRMRIAAVDLVSNTCFPALAAEVLGCFKSEGLAVEITLVPMLGATRALQEGSADAMIAGSVFDLLTDFPGWRGAKLAVALSQGTPWLLTVRADLAAERGDLQSLKGLTLTAAEGPDLVFKQLLRIAGLDPERDVEIIRLPGAKERHVSFGVFAAEALQQRKIDGYWSNAMGAETAVSRGIGKILVDVRRGDDPGEVRRFTFAGLGVSEKFLSAAPQEVEAAVRAIAKAQKALRDNPGLAREVGGAKFPSEAAGLISTIVARDAPFYDPVISEAAVAGLNRFAQSVGQLPGPVPYEQVVAMNCRPYWSA